MNMKVTPVGFTSAKQLSKVETKKLQNNNSVVTTPIAPAKNDSFEKSAFNPENAVKTLGSITVKDSAGNVTPKFNGVQLKYLQNELTNAPEKWNSVNALANKTYLKSFDVVRLSNLETDRLNVVKDYSDAVDYKSKPRYNASQLFEFADSKVNTQGLKNALPLSKTSLSPKNIVLLAQAKSPEFLQKTSKVVSEFENDVMKNKFSQIVFVRDNADRNAYNLMAENNNQVQSVLLDKDLNKEAVETINMYRTEAGKTYEIKKSNDLRNHTVSKVRMEFDETNYPVVTNEVRVIKDKNDKVVKTEYTAPSEIPGVFDIQVKYPDGKVDVVSSGKFDKKSGITTVKKNMVSLDGTRTDYLYENDENGNRISDYKITDKNGKVLLKKSATFEVVAPNKIISSNNDDKYEITLSDKSIDVKDLKRPEREIVSLDIDKKIQGNKKAILTSLKEMPGEELIKVAQSTKTLVGIDSPLESYYAPADKSIHSGDQLFVVLHELGHARDMRDVNLNSSLKLNETIGKAIFADEKLNKTFDEEKKNFNKAFPDAQRDHIDYFINTLNHYGGEVGGLRETIAESNALLTTPKTMELLAIRSQYLQQYFPRTIAHLSETLNKEAV